MRNRTKESQNIMHSIRTKLSVLDTAMFKMFLEANDMKDIIIGSYQDRVNNYQVDNRICYAYSDTFVEAIASMTYMSLKYGSVELAFDDFKKCIMSSDVNDPYFNWIP